MTSSLTSRVRSGVTWNAASVCLNYLTGIFRAVVLARLLAPDAFGLFGLALTIQAALIAFANVGLETFLVATRFETDDELTTHLNTIWTAELIKKAGLTILLLLAVYPTVRFYGEPQLYVILPLISLTPLIQGFQNIGWLIERKQVSFRRIVRLEQLNNLIATCTVIGCAWWTRSVWALVASQLMSAASGVVLSYLFHPWRPRLAFDRGAFSRAFNFGKYTVVINVMSYITTMADNIFIGRLQGASALGIYVAAYNFASQPVTIIASTIGNVMLPAYTELGAHGRERPERAFIRVFAPGSALLAMMAVVMALLADEIILVLYGAKWAAAGELLRILALVGFSRGHLNLISPFLVSRCGYAPEARAKTLEAVVFLTLLYPLTVRFGAQGAAWAGTVVYLFTMLNRLRLVRSLSPSVFRQVMKILSVVLFAGVTGLAAGLLVKTGIQSALLRLICGGAASALIMSAITLRLLPDLRRIGLIAMGRRV
ncbi:MAG TPA: oligosaccharide flippase family protein [Blastocatellia bacterium]|nr:oligosaccharide flippase family protein [Blastocatellia bacterium]